MWGLGFDGEVTTSVPSRNLFGQAAGSESYDNPKPIQLQDSCREPLTSSEVHMALYRVSAGSHLDSLHLPHSSLGSDDSLSQSGLRWSCAAPHRGPECPPQAPRCGADGAGVHSCRLHGARRHLPPPSFGYEVDDLHNGPYVYCSLSHEGARGLSEDAYIGIMTLQPDKLDGAYEQAFDGIQGFLDQAQERNAIPDIPADARDEISLIQDDDDGLVFMITSQSNVYNCLFGAGHGAEKVNGKYLVITQYESCELGDAATYTDRLKSLQTAARAAIERVEAAAQ